MTRVFPFDPVRKVYYNLEANFSGIPRPLPVTLYTIDATTGKASQQVYIIVLRLPDFGRCCPK